MNTDTAGFDLEPYPTSWGIAPSAMDRAVQLSADLVAAGHDMNTSVAAAMAYLKRVTA